MAILCLSSSLSSPFSTSSAIQFPTFRWESQRWPKACGPLSLAKQTPCWAFANMIHENIHLQCSIKLLLLLWVHEALECPSGNKNVHIMIFCQNNNNISILHVSPTISALSLPPSPVLLISSHLTFILVLGFKEHASLQTCYKVFGDLVNWLVVVVEFKTFTI